MRGRDGQPGWRRLTARWWLAMQVVPHLHVDKLGGITGVRQTLQPRIPVLGNKASKPLAEKTCGGWGSRISSQPHRLVHWGDPQGPGTYTKPPTQESAPEGLNLLVGSRGSNWKPAKSWASCIVPSQNPPPHTAPEQSDLGCPALLNT